MMLTGLKSQSTSTYSFITGISRQGNLQANYGVLESGGSAYSWSR